MRNTTKINQHNTIYVTSVHYVKQEYLSINTFINRCQSLLLFHTTKCMKKIAYLMLALALSSCSKEQDITNKDYTLTASARIWSTSKLQAAAIDSVKFEFFTKSNYQNAFAIRYTKNGDCQVVLKGNTEYWMRCTSPKYKNSHGVVYEYKQCVSNFMSTHEQNDKKHIYIPADFTVTFIEGQVQQGASSTTHIYNDPINF